MRRITFALAAILCFTASAIAQSIAEGVYVIRFSPNPDYVLTLRDGNATDINTVHLWQWKNDNSQKWKVTHTDGKIVIRSMVDNDYVLDVKDYVYSNETEIIVYTFHGSDNQLWVPEKQKNGSYVLLTAGDTGFCLDLHNGNAINDGFIKLYEAHKGEPQQWKFEKVSSTPAKTQPPKANGNAGDIPDGEYVVRFGPNTNYVLTLRDGEANNANSVHLWQWKNDNSQKWKVTHTNGKIVLRSMVDNNYVLNVTDAAFRNETPITVNTFRSASSQLWVPEKQENGSYVLLSSGDTGFCLDLHNGNAVNNGFIKLYEAHKEEPQQWVFEKAAPSRTDVGVEFDLEIDPDEIERKTPVLAEGIYVIRFTDNPMYVLTLQEGTASNNNPVYLWQWKNENSQKWRVTHTDGKIVIRSMVDNNFVLDVKDSNYSNNADLHIYRYQGKDNQLWIPERLGNGSYIMKIAGNTTFCLDLYKGHAVNGEKIELYTVHREGPEQWTFEKVSSK